MARKVHVQLVDDLSGEDAQETVRFSLDGANYEIDLTGEHATDLRGALSQYVAGGRRIRGNSSERTAKNPLVSRGETKAIRDWARAKGLNPSSRGRISEEVRQAYEADRA